MAFAFLYYMQNIDHLSSEERQHYIQCECGTYIDMRDLSEVFSHQHATAVPQSVHAEWSHSVRKGDPSAYPRKGGAIGLN